MKGSSAYSTGNRVSIIFKRFLDIPVDMIDFGRAPFHMVAFLKCGMNESGAFKLLKDPVGAPHCNMKVLSQIHTCQFTPFQENKKPVQAVDRCSRKRRFISDFLYLRRENLAGNHRMICVKRSGQLVLRINEVGIGRVPGCPESKLSVVKGFIHCIADSV